MIRIGFGTRVVVMLTLFTALILSLVFMSMGHKVDLVSADYYAKELAYQTAIDARNNFDELHDEILIEVTDTAVSFTLPAAAIDSYESGECLFFRPSDSDLDKQYSMTVNDGVFTVVKKELRPGKYLAKFTWLSGGKSYLQNITIII